MLHEGKRLTVLINDFLDLQRLEAGQVEVSIAPVDMCTAVRRALEVLGHDAEHPMQLDLARIYRGCWRMPIGCSKCCSTSCRMRASTVPTAGQSPWPQKCGPGDTLEVTIADRGLGLPHERRYRSCNWLPGSRMPMVRGWR